MGRYALVGDNSIEFVDRLLKIWNTGNCAVLINGKIPQNVIVALLREAEVEKCFIERKYYESIDENIVEHIDFTPYDVSYPGAHLLPQSIYDNYIENYSKDEAIVIYSSGTTGNSKGIILTHFAISTNADAIIDCVQPSNDCIYIVRELTHSSTITGELLVALKTRTPVLIAPVVVPPRYVLNNIEKFNVTIIGVNPLLLSMYCYEYKNKTYNLSSLKKIYVGGSILSDETYLLAHEVFCEQELFNVYGLSEAGPRVTTQRYDSCADNSVGKAIKGVELIVVDENGNIVAPGKRGIIHVNSPSLFKGYIRGELKHKSLYHNWLNTGDIGFLNSNGELYIVGRYDDMIIIDGHKVYPSDVERQIRNVYQIYECTVLVASVHHHEALCCLYVSDEDINFKAIRKLGNVLMKHEIPKWFIRTDSIPHTLNGKIATNQVRKVIENELEDNAI